ncbi:hypothetical protein C9446_12860 [Providencia heimbachae]|uniref:colicin immunity protein Cui n=1 Tax=Providencia heimbachae TaxID=333962 RepID=UPI0010BF4784|nr:colicin immunity protein Cui [Providencia heimbachae]QCJ70664.1 hypothetical protein C9446_12860 [Providencia heimbachae]
MRASQNNSMLVFIGICLLGAIPLIVIWLGIVPQTIIENINDWIGEIPIIYSDNFLYESYLSALYCKAVPLFSILYYTLIWNNTAVKEEHFKLYRNGIGMFFFGYLSAAVIFSMVVYVNYFLNYNTSIGNRRMKLISEFEITSFLYYYAIFFVVFMMACAAINIFLFLPIKYAKKRWG